MIATSRRWIRVLLGVVVAVVVLTVARRLLRPDPSAPATRPAGPPPTPRPPRAVPDPVTPEPLADAPPDDGEAADGGSLDDEPATGGEAATPPAAPDGGPGGEEVQGGADGPAGAGAAWIASTDGTCPLSHPVKAKDSSRIFHVEGGLSYERTRADRCYRSPEDAEADGYRAAKR